MYTSSLCFGNVPFFLCSKKSQFSRSAMLSLGSRSSMFSNRRVYPRRGNAWYRSPKYRSSVVVRHGRRIKTDASSSFGYLSHCFFV